MEDSPTVENIFKGEIAYDLLNWTSTPPDLRHAKLPHPRVHCLFDKRCGSLLRLFEFLIRRLRPKPLQASACEPQHGQAWIGAPS